MGTKRAAWSRRVATLIAGAGIGFGLGGLLGANLDLSQIETRGLLVIIVGVSVAALLMAYYERRLAKHVDRLTEEYKEAQTEAYLQGYLAAIQEHVS